MIQALGALMDPGTLGLILIGVVLGIIFGAIPGLSASTGIALMLPMTFVLSPTAALAFLGGLFVGGYSGGLISAILIGVPGTPASVATVYDGYPMTRKGQATRALSAGIICSALSTFLSVVVAMLFCPPLARVAVNFGPWEQFSLCFTAIILVVTISKGNMFNGLISAFLGMLFATVGSAPLDGAMRFTFGNYSLYGGINVLAVMMGIFAMTSLVGNFARGEMECPDVDTKGIKGFGVTLKDMGKYAWLYIKSFFIGLWIGFLPGMGGGLSNIVAYVQAKSSSKTPEEFGKGCVEGVIASESANNASVGGAIIPMIALGIPGDACTAMLLSGLMIQGIEAGPLLMTNSKALVYAFFISLLLSTIVTFLLQFFGMRTFPYILKIPTHFLYAAIFAICYIGVYSNSMSLFTCLLMIGFCVVGFILAMGNMSSAPFILGFILGPMLETNLRKGLTYTSQGFLPFITRPVSGILLLVAVCSLFWPFIRDRRAAKKAGKTVAEVQLEDEKNNE